MCAMSSHFRELQEMRDTSGLIDSDNSQAGPCGKSDPRHRRQLCDPQTSKECLGSPARSVQIPALVRQAKESGVPHYIGRGLSRWSNVHIADVAALYVLAAAKAPQGSRSVRREWRGTLGEIVQSNCGPAPSWGCTIHISRRGDRVLGPEPVDILPWLQRPRGRG